MMMVPTARSPVLTPGPTELRFEAAGYSTVAAIGDEVFVNNDDVTTNGQQFLMLKGNNPQVRVNVVYNWRRERFERACNEGDL
jgi:hypothetical protein